MPLCFMDWGVQKWTNTNLNPCTVTCFLSFYVHVWINVCTYQSAYFIHDAFPIHFRRSFCSSFYIFNFDFVVLCTFLFSIQFRMVSLITTRALSKSQMDTIKASRTEVLFCRCATALHHIELWLTVNI